jgi:large subunit ribosomal protein L25
MATELILMAEPRTVLGKQVKALRRQGLVPGVVYGPALTGETIQVSVNRRDLERFYQAHGHSTLFTLTWGDGKHQVFIKEVQVEPVRRAPLHVDFFAPNLDRDLTARVPVVLHNHAATAEGVLTQLMDEVEVRARPATLPHQLDADISGLLHVHDSIRAGDLQLPDGVALISDPEAVIATLVAQAVEEVEEEAEEAAAEAAPEGEAAAESETAEEPAADADASES